MKITYDKFMLSTKKLNDLGLVGDNGITEKGIDFSKSFTYPVKLNGVSLTKMDIVILKQYVDVEDLFTFNVEDLFVE